MPGWSRWLWHRSGRGSPWQWAARRTEAPGWCCKKSLGRKIKTKTNFLGRGRESGATSHFTFIPVVLCRIGIRMLLLWWKEMSSFLPFTSVFLGTGDTLTWEMRRQRRTEELTAAVVGVAHVVRWSVTAVVWVGGSRVDGNVLAPIHLGQTWSYSSLRPHHDLPRQPRSFHPLYLLLGLQTPRVNSSHEVGFCADIIVSFVHDKVHAGIICGLCSKTEWH